MESMKHIPQSPLDLYINLYCKKRQSLDENIKKDYKLLKEATKSWLSLNDDEKMIFISKQDEIIAEHKQKIAVSLKNVKPYLRKKNQNHTARSENSKISDICVHNRVETSLNEHFPETSAQNVSIGTCADTHDKKIYRSDDFTENQQIPSDMNEKGNITQNQAFIRERLPEPIPPSVMSGKELFLLLGIDSENYPNWESLPGYKKRHYQSAVLTIKRNYIRSYRTFLESLEPKELHQFYIDNKEIN